MRARRLPRDPDPLCAQRRWRIDNLDRPVHTIPNAVPFLFGDQALADVAAGIELLALGEKRAG
jgi:hypothetical protein